MAKKKARIKAQQRKAWETKRNRRKKIRHNTAANQEKHRPDWQTLEPDEFGAIADRRIMPRDEAGCAGQKAVSAGALPSWRLENYVKLLLELPV